MILELIAMAGFGAATYYYILTKYRMNFNDYEFHLFSDRHEFNNLFVFGGTAENRTKLANYIVEYFGRHMNIAIINLEQVVNTFYDGDLKMLTTPTDEKINRLIDFIRQEVQRHDGITVITGNVTHCKLLDQMMKIQSSRSVFITTGATANYSDVRYYAKLNGVKFD